MTITNAFLTYAALGYGPARLLPIIPPDATVSERSSLHKRVGTEQDPRGKTPGVKNRAGEWHSFDWVPYEADEHDLTRWHAMGAGVGIKTGNGLIAIDAESIKFYESRAVLNTVKEVRESRLVAIFDFSGEGQTWSMEETLDLQNDGKELVRTEKGENAMTEPLRYAKCA